MSWRDAPLYIEANDLAVWILGRCRRWPKDSSRLCCRIEEDACELVSRVSLALTFPPGRAGQLRSADETIVRLRSNLRLAHQLELLPDRGLRHACQKLRIVGKMVGGWRKRLRAGDLVESSHQQPALKL